MNQKDEKEFEDTVKELMMLSKSDMIRTLTNAYLEQGLSKEERLQSMEDVHKISRGNKEISEELIKTFAKIDAENQMKFMHVWDSEFTFEEIKIIWDIVTSKDYQKYLSRINKSIGICLGKSMETGYEHREKFTN
jgi:hypothetical protein